MEPLTKIELRTCKWLGVLAFACAVTAELLDLARGPNGQGATFAARERLRRAGRQIQPGSRYWRR